MKYSLLLAAVAAQRFPVDDIFHTHCTMNTTLADSGDKAWAAIENTVKTIADPALFTLQRTGQLMGVGDKKGSTTQSPGRRYPVYL